ncbi:uncharacterized protein LOC113233319 [Hyposmocoma kahamanoa]|uniref:uncharacterized protein LOC113233319 n=1 Tax=Hyposmocoma kahamanoa TaxID=1477025 RepID=UPI000E6D7AD4|nr:uncharacterized protein LOC113233319 [Hyposmocoma kahamanoa]
MEGNIKLQLLFLKQPVYKKLIKDLMELWPVVTDNEEAAEIKRQSLRALRFGSYSFIAVNMFGGIFYNGTPVAIHFYRTLHGIPSDLGYAWNTVYPLDKTKPVYHELTYLYETYTTMMVAVLAMAGSDLLFTSISSHITLLLRLLQLKIRSLGTEPNEFSGPVDCYEETISAIKIHQKLVSYTNDAEALFSLLNLVNVLLSSFIICFVVFNIVTLRNAYSYFALLYTMYKQ